MEQQDNNDMVQERIALKVEIHELQKMVAKKTYVTKKSEKTIAGRMLPIKVLQLAVLTLEKQTTWSAKETNKYKAHTKALKKLSGCNNSDTISNIARHKHLEDNKLALCMLKGKMSAYNSLLEGSKEPECVIDTDEQAAAKYEDEMAKQNKEADEQAGEVESGNDNMADGEGSQDNEVIIVVNDDGGQGSQSGPSGQGPVKSEFEG